MESKIIQTFALDLSKFYYLENQNIFKIILIKIKSDT